MIYKDRYRMLDDEEKAHYIPALCELCGFYDNCELNNNFIVKQIQKNAASPVVTKWPKKNKKGNMEAVFPIVMGVKDNQTYPHCPVRNLPYYMQEIWEGGVCPVKGFTHIECGLQWVSNGLGDHFKIDLIRDYSDYRLEQFKIDKSSYKSNKYKTNKWEPRQPVIISSPTGGGKNTFAEQDLPKYIRELNHRHKTNHRILIFSNRRALTEQARDRLERGISEDDTIYYNYRDYVDVMPYHSLLNKAEYLKQVQQGKAKYLFVICDEAHFFASDAAFNPDTEKILEAIVDIFQKAIRVYMTATPYEVLGIIQEKEYRKEKCINGVMYHFRRDYSYLNTKCFSDVIELLDIITNSVVNNNEKWLIFIDNMKQIATIKNLLEYRDGEATALKGKVMAVDADSKRNDKKYQEMIISENFAKDVNVVIATSVIDNGVNFRNIDNVVVTDINRTKCLQMVGRARVDKDPVTKAPLGKVTLYIKRHDASFISKRLKSVGVQQDAYHDYDMLSQTTNDEWRFQYKYKDNEQEDWENSKHWFGRDRREPNRLYSNNIARLLANKQARVYESILEEMETTGKGKSVVGQKYLEFQLSWFGKKYSKKNDITLSGYKTDEQLGFEKWVQEEWIGKQIPKESQKDFGRLFFAKFNPIFGLCTKKQGFGSDDNRGENGPKTTGYSIKRIKEIFQVKNMPFEVIAGDGNCVTIHTKRREG